MYKVIVVDDHPFVRASVKALLSQDGFDIVGETGNGQEAIRLVRDLQPLDRAGYRHSRSRWF